MSDALPGLTIRRARPDELGRLLELLIAGFRGRSIHHWLEQRFGQIGGQPWEHWKEQELIRFWDQHADQVLVAERGGEVVGFVTYVLDREREVGEIRNNAVDPAHCGQGIGSALYQRVLDIFREEGMKYAWVETGLEPEYAPARRAYEKVGFTPFHEALYLVRKL